ncbi:MAG: porphobilinogen synthase [Oscillospiraceae bacterium]|jgi:porphobilinogen synthase|nr:porphobilinogen synthase [Oscillospiraceae bacterium]
MAALDFTKRPRRLRVNAGVRELARETRVSEKSLIYPLFITEGSGVRNEIGSMPGQYHYSADTVGEAVASCLDAGADKFLLFGLPEHKDETGSGAWADDGAVQNVLRTLRRDFPAALLISDACLCEYTSHGHCGVVENGKINNDKTLELLTKTAVSHARAGADIIAPSDMMDFRVGAIRAGLDGAGFEDALILSYAVKYASGFYGPFREAAKSAPAFGDRRTYQMDYHNVREALREAASDEAEGADMLMVKPTMSYLDVLAGVRAQTNLPLAAYSVSGEYAMIKTAAAAGLIDEYAVMCETAIGVYRAGADMLISYYAPELARAIRKGDIG